MKKLFNLKTGATIGVLTLIALILLGLIIPQCHAAEAFDPPYAQFSVGSAVIRGSTPVIDLSVVEPLNIVPHSFVQVGMTAVGESTFKGHDYNNNLIWRALFGDGLGHFDFAIGISYMTNYLPYNGGHVNANLQIDYRFRKVPVTITYTHFSDGGSVEPNYGRDLVLVGYRFH